ncbi:MAG: 4Fe-4S ferredoxin [Bacteroidetes bacterium GWF2_49_14]|nr:MAG: 4Fe-4S ferredoxin [Bacteroidetes bacterium GWF2_49_14]HBB90284.1 4Fe-4S ferredoxin [Bacteroidales bacterium]
MKREIITIDEERCNGCGLCVPNCHEGALQIIDGKARLISDLMCDGLGACIGHCPEGAIAIEEREAEPYDEIKVMEQMMSKGKNTLIAHLGHLKEHGEKEFLRQGVRYMLEHQDELDFNADEVLGALHATPTPHTDTQTHLEHGAGAACGCQGSQTKTFGAGATVMASGSVNNQPSALTHWPVQMHLLNPKAGHFQGSNLLLAADCTAFSLGNFHSSFLNGKTLAIACPKLDSNREVYVDKLRVLIEESQIDTLTVMVMEVPCCNGLLQIAEVALSQSSRQVPVKVIVVTVDGQIKVEKWHRV